MMKAGGDFKLELVPKIEPYTLLVDLKKAISMKDPTFALNFSNFILLKKTYLRNVHSLKCSQP